MSKLLKIDEISEGMILAKPILNKMGQVMIAKGIAINQKQINILKMWGISEVSIQTDKEEPQERNDLLLIENAKKNVIEELRWEIDNPYLDEIVELVAQSKLNFN